MIKIHCAFLVLVAVLITSCGRVSESPIESYKTLSAAEISSLIYSNVPPLSIVPAITLQDRNYILPTKKWVEGNFTAQLSKFLFDYNIALYNEEKNDCDKFSLYGRAVANILNRHNPNNKNTGVAVGQISIFRGVSGHSINFMVISDKDGNCDVIYYEPQTLRITTLNPESDIRVSYNL